MQSKKAICHKFEDAVERTREQTAQYWNELALPKIKATQRKPKPEKKKKNHLAGLAKAYAEVDERDERRCQFPSCYSTNTNHHHILFKSQGGKNDLENLVTLCPAHHVLEKDISAHRSVAWQRYWQGWAEDRYPKYWQEIREGQKIQQYNNNTAIGG